MMQEDIHSWVESKLIDKVGNLGKKLHTGRSRNDQVALDIKMWCKQRNRSYKSLFVIFNVIWCKQRKRRKMR